VLVLILADVFCALLCVHHVLAAHPVMDVAMISSLQVGRGYHSASMVDNRTHTKVSSLALRMLSQPINQPLNFLFWALKFIL
jgi:hypothetical protein